MTTSPTDELFDRIESHNAILHPQSEQDLLHPSYSFYALAPWWTPEQAACLLSRLTPIDEETVRVLTTIPDNNFLKLCLQLPRSRNSASKVASYQNFCDYVAWQFPIKVSNVVRLSNIHRVLTAAVKDGGIVSRPARRKPAQYLLRPEDVVVWASRQDIQLHPDLKEGMKQRCHIDYLGIPDAPFPNRICFYGPYCTARISRNLQQPRSICSVTTSQVPSKSPPKDSSPSSSNSQSNVKKCANSSQSSTNLIDDERLSTANQNFDGFSKPGKTPDVIPLSSPCKKSFLTKLNAANIST